jgi:hypothetical protein
MTEAERAKAKSDRYKSLGLCVKCGKENDRPYVMCSKCKERRYENLLRRKYGLSLETFQDLLKKQNYQCVCGLLLNNNTKIVVDHCHNTNVVRGLLCNPCNTAIGLLKDNSDVLRNLANYLEDNNNLKIVPLSIKRPEDTRALGENHPRAILTEIQVKEIKFVHIPGGLTNGKIAEIYGIHKNRVSDIRRGTHWKYITNNTA